MRTCAVVTCKNKGVHIFPTDENLRRQWVKATRTDVHRKIGWHLRKYSCVCSAHFTPSDFETFGTFRRLKRTAVPSVFPWPTMVLASSSDIVLRDPLLPDLVENTFNPANAVKNYSRLDPPTMFVEEYPTLNIEMCLDDVDPLHINSDDTKNSENPSPVPDESGVEIEVITTTYITEIQDETTKEHETNLNQNQTSQYCNKSVQTTHSIEPFLGTPKSLHKCKCTDKVIFCNKSVQTNNSTESLSGPDKSLSSVHKCKSSDKVIHCDRSAQTTAHATKSFSRTDERFLSVHKCKSSDNLIHFYTGLETFEKLMYVFYTLGDYSNLKYFYKTSPKLEALEQFFITLIILRRHKEFEDLASLFFITVKEVADIFITWIRFMTLQWKNLDLWINREKVKSYMPLDFYDKYPMTRVVLDATECPIKKPGLPLAQQITFSSYKNRNTVKFLIGIAPSGLITYVSPCYGGSATDRQILERSDILSRFDYNDEIMVDKGLNVQDMLMPYGVKVNMPTFFKKGNQITPEILVRDRKVASKRVHVERIIGMMKTYKILKQPMNQTETILASDIAFVCAMLVNYRSNIVSKFS